MQAGGQLAVNNKLHLCPPDTNASTLCGHYFLNFLLLLISPNAITQNTLNNVAISKIDNKKLSHSIFSIYCIIRHKCLMC